MFIRQVKKQRNPNSKIFYQYNLVQSSRVDGKSRQRIILYMGSDPLLSDPENRKIVVKLLKARIFPNNRQAELIPLDVNSKLAALTDTFYEKYLIKYGDVGEQNTNLHKPPCIPPDPGKADYQQVDLNGVDCDDVKTFGCEHLCSHILKKLALDDYLKKLRWSKSDRELALLSIAGRAIFTASEFKTCRYLKHNSDLINCLSLSENETIYHKQLYRIADKLYENKQGIDKYLYAHISNLFNLEDKLVIFDLSNTYFESRKDNSELAQFGRSKEKRKDCKLVVFSGVINAEGFMRHSRIYKGNMPDVNTLEDMLADLEANSGKNKGKTVVIDAGIASNDNLKLIAGKGYKYVCVARTKLKDYEVKIEGEKIVQLTGRDKKQIELKLVQQTEGMEDTWMYVKSEDKRIKEQSMRDKLSDRFIEGLEQIKKSIHKKGGTKTLNKVWERLGRVKEKYPSIAKLYVIDVLEKKEENAKPQKTQKKQAADITWNKKENINPTDEHGVYFIRTNYKDVEEQQLWNIYNTIREVEATFRCLKSQLNIRPVHHQLDSRIESHIYLTILAYQLVNTIRYMLKQDNIFYDWSNIVRIMNTHTIQNVILPTPEKTIHLRKPSKPIELVQQIYSATKCPHTRTVNKKYVVYH